MTDMVEYLLWDNCNNNCSFCWQKKMCRPDTHLNEEHMLDSISKCSTSIDSLGYTDILIVGGEVYCPRETAITDALGGLFDKIAGHIRGGQTRYLYVNTNLIYNDLTVIDRLMQAFDGIEDSIKFTTSLDVYGRYSKEEDENLATGNLVKLRDRYPKLNIAVNMILTKQFCELYRSGKKDGGVCLKDIMNGYGVKYVNLIPYIPVPDDDSMTPSWGQVIAALVNADKEIPGYLDHYIDDYDLNQNKILYEYHIGQGYVECTAEYLPCGHNKNFTKATPDGSCYICELKKEFRN